MSQTTPGRFQNCLSVCGEGRGRGGFTWATTSEIEAEPTMTLYLCLRRIPAWIQAFTQTHRHTDTQTHRHTDTQTEIELVPLEKLSSSKRSFQRHNYSLCNGGKVNVEDCLQCCCLIRCQGYNKEGGTFRSMGRQFKNEHSII